MSPSTFKKRPKTKQKSECVGSLRCLDTPVTLILTSAAMWSTEKKRHFNMCFGGCSPGCLILAAKPIQLNSLCLCKFLMSLWLTRTCATLWLCTRICKPSSRPAIRTWRCSGRTKWILTNSRRKLPNLSKKKSSSWPRLICSRTRGTKTISRHFWRRLLN